MPKYSGVVFVEAVVEEDELDHDDTDTEGEYTFLVTADNDKQAEELILDKFHDTVPISMLEDFSISVKHLSAQNPQPTTGTQWQMVWPEKRKVSDKFVLDWARDLIMTDAEDRHKHLSPNERYDIGEDEYREEIDDDPMQAIDFLVDYGAAEFDPSEQKEWAK